MFRRRRKAEEPRPPPPPPDATPHELYVLAQGATDPAQRDHLLRLAADAGHVIALYDLGRAAVRAGDVATAVELLTRSRDGGYKLAGGELAGLGPAAPADDDADGPPDEVARLLDEVEELRDRGRLAQARDLLARAAELGSGRAALELADLLPYGEPRKEALYRQAALTGDRQAAWQLSRVLEREGRQDEMVEVWAHLAPTRYWAKDRLAHALEAAGRLEEAVAAYRVAMRDPRHTTACAARYLALRAQGVPDDDPEEGERLAAQAGRPLPGRVDTPARAATDPERDWGGELLAAWRAEVAGDHDRAEVLYRDLALSDHKQAEAQAGLARMLDRRGETAEAERWREQAEAMGADLHPPGAD